MKLPPLLRFAQYCRHDPITGCVNWVGGTTRGRGKTCKYGCFWFLKRSWRAHRWAGIHIHNLDVGPDDHVDHKCCNALCVQHLQATTPAHNTALYWIRIQVGLEELEQERIEEDPNGIPFYRAPEWLVAAHKRLRNDYGRVDILPEYGEAPF